MKEWIRTLCSRGGALSAATDMRDEDEEGTQQALSEMRDRMRTEAAAAMRSYDEMVRSAKKFCRTNPAEQKRLLRIALECKQKSKRLSDRAEVISQRMRDASTVVDDAATATYLMRLDMETKAAVDRAGGQFKKMEKKEDELAETVSDAEEMSASIQDGGAGWSAALVAGDAGDEPEDEELASMIRTQREEDAEELRLPETRAVGGSSSASRGSLNHYEERGIASASPAAMSTIEASMRKLMQGDH